MAFAKALAQKTGVKMYAAAWCPACNSQKALFEDGADFLPFIEVTNPDRTLNAAGIAANITSYPTWEFPDGTREVGRLVAGDDCPTSWRGDSDGYHSDDRSDRRHDALRRLAAATWPSMATIPTAER